MSKSVTLGQCQDNTYVIATDTVLSQPPTAGLYQHQDYFTTINQHTSPHRPAQHTLPTALANPAHPSPPLGRHAAPLTFPEPLVSDSSLQSLCMSVPHWAFSRGSRSSFSSRSRSWNCTCGRRAPAPSEEDAQGMSAELSDLAGMHVT